MRTSPLRRTQQGDFFKRDLERLRTDPLLAAPPSDALITVPDTGLFVVALALAMGHLVEQEEKSALPRKRTNRAASSPHRWQRSGRHCHWFGGGIRSTGGFPQNRPARPTFPYNTWPSFHSVDSPRINGFCPRIYKTN